MARLMQSQSVLDLRERVEWVRVILNSAQASALENVEWQILLCWMCAHFDDRFNSTLQFLDTIMGQDKVRLFGGAWSFALSPTAWSLSMSAKFELRHFQIDQELNLVEHATRTTNDFLTGAAPPNMQADQWEFYYTSRCPLTHLLLGLRDRRAGKDQTRQRIKFMYRLLDYGATYVEWASVWVLIKFSKVARDPNVADLAHFPDEDFNQVLRRFCWRFEADRAGSDSMSLATWLGSYVLPIACLEGHLFAVKSLVDLGADINVKNPYSHHIPIMLSHDPAVFDFLLRHRNANLKAVDSYGGSNILVSAIKQGTQRSDKNAVDETLAQVKFILEHAHGAIIDRPATPAGDDPATTPGASGEDIAPLVLATYGNDSWLPLVHMLLDAGANPNVRIADWYAASRSFREPLLHHVVSQPLIRTALVNVLVDRGARALDSRTWRSPSEAFEQKSKKYEVLGGSDPAPGRKMGGSVKDKGQTRAQKKQR